MKYLFALTFFINLVIDCNAQEVKIPETNFSTPKHPTNYLLDQFSGLYPDTFNGPIKTATSVQNLDWGEKYTHYKIVHQYNSNGKRTLTTNQTIKSDCCGEELLNRTDTIYPNPHPYIKITRTSNTMVEVLNTEIDTVRTVYKMSNTNKPIEAINKDNEVYLTYNKKGQLIERKSFHLVKGYNDNDEEYTRYKYNNIIEKATYNNAGQLIQLKEQFYEHFFKTYGEREYTYTYSKTGQLIKKEQTSVDYIVAHFENTKPIEQQQWTNKTEDSKSEIIETFEYNDEGNIVRANYKNGIERSHYKVYYQDRSIRIEHVGFVGTENQSIIEKRLVKLDPHRNPIKVKVNARGENGGFIETGEEDFNIEYTYYKQ